MGEYGDIDAADADGEAFGETDLDDFDGKGVKLGAVVARGVSEPLGEPDGEESGEAASPGEGASDDDGNGEGASESDADGDGFGTADCVASGDISGGSVLRF